MGEWHLPVGLDLFLGVFLGLENLTLNFALVVDFDLIFGHVHVSNTIFSSRKLMSFDENAKLHNHHLFTFATSQFSKKYMYFIYLFIFLYIC